MDGPSRIREWVQSKFGRKHYEEPIAPEAPAFLSSLSLVSKHQRSVSSSLSRTAEISDPVPKAVANSPLFKLPPELRNLIYEFAFGGRILHLELQPKFICMYPVGMSLGYKSQYHCDDSTEREFWHWWSSVCRRHPVKDPWMDHCRRNWAESLLFPSGKCPLGIMGFMLTSRQAYAECIDVLYRANTFYTSSTLLMRSFPALVPSRHLHRITSLELSLKLFLLDGPAPLKEDTLVGWPTLDVIISIIVSHFRSLRMLYLAVHTGNATAFPGQRREISDAEFERLWSRTDKISRSFGKQLRTFVLAPQASVFLEIEDMARQAPADVENPTLQMRDGRVWRSVTTEDPEVDDLGFWIEQGAGDYMALCNVDAALERINA
ncbi:predicted protein [Uncinocarpus reesii 1704]|uniref:DUF7730 domain-containing protein n=1 Tax=Uncinocarpus reesii (strain UAMH 1704) TaxID=336963 RepID=C4JE51_UNCRE|nr:uncharacterized protein UREG_00473 [Uncinocarpus reesii 1704]EEP75627.1 predicted protein [Uncinocarpus reesii 1704]